ncbi:DUF3124 domain-containing protein [Gloeocapsopsis dulcis]|uniref:DUF3124 domain-containing protein n=1 Tax=Gloeocapsopsis dulcis AAB1 = 1H9 TaxID=1433147 RepID=A0A6N8FU75_9CHRO|nr:DUF3124 domain-containing protein [Gloeocapsopsis dulcis]MUL35496.1 hypothetical protein [Gloeocapsopsis dulcis AAB1 = 1H9]WNN87603.1 DUF3124 domain-containing protein [Gloeocapsopsis dulcis]
MSEEISRVLAIVTMIVLSACTSPTTTPHQGDRNPVNQPQQFTLDENSKIATGQTLYVPVYSYIYHDDGRRIFNLATTLSIRNTDLANPIIITCVRYYNSSGQLVRQYLERPIQVAALASTEFFINTTDNSGGLGANFIVDWVAQTNVSEPIIEAVMIGTGFQQGISFISPGKVIQSQTNYTCSSS